MFYEEGKLSSMFATVCASNRAISKGIGHIFYMTVMVNYIINGSLNTAVIVCLVLPSIKMAPLSRF